MYTISLPGEVASHVLMQASLPTAALQGLHFLFSVKEEYAEVLDMIVVKLDAKEMSAAASTCKALQTAVKGALTSLHLNTEEDVLLVAAAVAKGEYHRVARLHIGDKAAASPHLATLVALLAPKLQQLISSGNSPSIIPCLATLVSYSTLSSLSLTLPSLHPASQGPLLIRLLGQLTCLTALTLDIDEPPAALTSTPFPLASLPQLNQLALGGKVAVCSLPPGLTALTLTNHAASVLPHVSSCLSLQRLGFDAAILPDDHDTSQHLWDTLAPLTALSALEGTFEVYGSGEVDSDHWAEVGAAAADSLAVAQRLKRLCLGDVSSPTMLDGMDVSWFMGPCGDLSVLTNLEALWVQFSAVGGVPQNPPPRLRELRVNVYEGDEDTNLCSYTGLTSLTLELSADNPMLPLLPVAELRELVVVCHVDVEGQLGNFDFMPKLQRFTYHGKELKSTVLAAILSLGPSLEEVELFVEDPQAVSEAAQEFLEPKRHKPVVKVS
jgi:hypothetical protein